MTVLTLSTLGPFQAQLDDQPITHFHTRKVQALLIYLVVESDRHQRENLMELMWPGMPERSARHNLRQALYFLRSAVPDLNSSLDGAQPEVSFLLANRQTIQVNPQASVAVDASDFESLVNGVQAHEHINVLTCSTCLANLEEAIALYQGDFLADFYLDDSNVFEDWSQIRRETYRRKVLDALELLTAAATRQGEYPKAQAYAKRQLEIDDLRESAYRQLMEILALSGHREEALAVYENCRRLLAEELSMAPARRTTEMSEKIMAGDITFDTPAARGVRGYELKQEIGVGLYGAIHLAYQSNVNREVAVKVIQRRYANDPEYIRRFDNEAQTIARLEHPFIVPLYDYWREPDGAYLVMRYMKGGSLLTALEKNPWGPDRTSQMLDQVASALSAAHQQGVIHRDIKPANILLDGSGNAYLSDFGIATNLGGSRQFTAAGAILGTPDYISPEQILNEPVSPQSDIYSLGGVLYETLTGEKPFGDSSLANLIYKQLNNPFPLVSSSRPDLPVEIDRVIQKATSKRPADRYREAVEMADAFRLACIGSAVDETPPAHIASPPGFEPYNPYKGLNAFQEADTDDFFGRNALIERLIEHLTPSQDRSPKNDDELAVDRFLALVGPSGSGKSSVVKAGLLPALRAGAVPHSDKWFFAEMVPGTHPLEELEMALWPVAVDAPPSLVEPMQRDVRGLLRTIRRILPDENDGQGQHPIPQLLLVIDQFEEIFTLVEDEERRNFFLESLLAAISAPRSPLRVVITLRADFYDRPLQFQTLGKLLKACTEIVLPMTPEEITWAVREPARRMGVGLEEGLAELIVADVVDQLGSLPLMQYALTELFERRQGSQMTLEHYQEIGGVTGALGRRAEELYTSLDDDQQEMAHQLFLRLVTLGEGVEDTRRRVLKLELEALGDQKSAFDEDPHPIAAVQQPMTSVIDSFGAARLLTFDHDPVSREATVEVAHEALLREWSRLRSWLDESRDDIRLQQRLARATGEWLAAGRDESYLLRGAQLAQVEGWSDASNIVLTRDESAFLGASIDTREARQATEEARRQQELETAQKLAQTEKERAETEAKRAEEQSAAAQRLRRRAFFLVGALVIAGLLAIVAVINGNRATQNADVAQNLALIAGSQAALANGDTDGALALAWQAATLNPASSLAEAQLSEAAYAPGTARLLIGQNDNPYSNFSSVAISPDGKTALVGSEDSVVMLWDLETAEILWKKVEHNKTINDVDFNPNGQNAVSVSDETTVLWDVKTGQVIHRLDGHEEFISKVAFAPDGQSMVTGGFGDDPTVVVWDVASGEVRRRFKSKSKVEGIVYTPDGAHILYGGFDDGTLTMIDAQTGKVIREMKSGLGISSGTLRSIAVSPDGLTAIAGFENGMLLWDLSTGELLQRYALSDGATSVAFHPYNGAVLVGDKAGTLGYLDLQTGEKLNVFKGHKEYISSVSITPDGKYGVTVARDATLRVWELDRGQVIRRFNTPTEAAWEVDLSPDGRTALSSSQNGTVILWDAETGEVIHEFTDDQPINAVTFSPDGKMALTGAGYRFAQKLEPGHIILWDLETGEEIRRFVGHPYAVFDVEFSSDGNRAVSSGNGAMVILWNVETGQEIRRFDDYFFDSPYPIKSFWDVEFAPEGTTILASHAEGPLILWDAESGAEIGRFEGHNNSGATGITFTKDGRKVVSGGWDGQAILWDLQNGSIIRRFKNHVGSVGQIAFSPDESLILGGSSDGKTTLWDVETGEVIRRYRNGFVIKPVFNSDRSQALVGFSDGALELWRMDTTLEDLMAWTEANRYIPELTCEQRALYGIEPLCEPEE